MEKLSLNNNFKIKINEIPHGGAHFHFSHRTHDLDAQLADVLGQSPHYEIAVDVENQDQITKVIGHLEGRLPQVCSRCAEDFEVDLDKNFTTLFYKSEDEIKTMSEGFEGLHSAFEMEHITGNEIDLSEIIHEQCALEIPYQPVCGENCLGLCSRCGANLNMERNHIHPDVLQNDSPFAKLKDFRGE